jgi:fucose permease
MVGVLLLGFVLVIVLLFCSFVQASFPLALSVVSILVASMVAAGGGAVAEAIVGGGVIMAGGLVLATASDTYEEIRRARRRARPRRRPRVAPLPEAEQEIHERSRAA